ncbi:uncharacterized protein LOC106155687 isoform X2 [Lingula anatina]|uniref:Uncharacterized protein LOC106155687 isoform X1 n=1 Tax=Lingula anatina TaxID=7574 RepID=A0A1S3HM27_LINAN|nr:uncharacterized protein LOC106155687 isoform X1 [Lingula anatina]XP_023933420.1 uncharacterized protein LOC106155687 isoform X2 [Lingula anatina]|eukprot:XP_013386079.1 uncharacterized protein LOC106155687 isoform X1 [Lingula anatina]
MEENETQGAQTLSMYLKKHRKNQLRFYILSISVTSSAWVIGCYGFSYTWVFVLLSVLFLIWRTKLLHLTDSEYRQHEILVHRKRALAHGETAEWVNFIVNRWWVFSSTSLFGIIKSHLDSALNGESKPLFIDQMEVRSFTLGNHTPHVKNVRVFESSDGITEQATWLNIDSPPDGLKVALSHRVVLEADIGVCDEGFQMIFHARLGGRRMGVNCEAAVERLSLRGKVQLILHLSMDVPFPHVAKLTMYFVERPEVWFSIRILKAVQVMELPLLKTWLHSLVLEALTDVLVDPNNIDIELCQPTTPVSATAKSSAVGVVTVVLSGGQICRASTSVFNLPDAVHYCVVQLGDQKKYTVNVKGEASWQSMLSFLVHNPKHDKIFIKLKCRKLLHSSTMAQFEVPLKSYKLEKHGNYKVDLDKKTLLALKGAVKLEMHMTYTPLPRVELEAPLSEQGDEEKSCNAGVLYVHVHSAKELSSKFKDSVSPYCVLVVNRRRVKTSLPEALSKNPKWDCFAEFFVADYSKVPVSVLVIDQSKKSDMEEELLGCAVITLNEGEIRKVRQKIPLKAGPQCTAPNTSGSITVSLLFRPIASVAHSESSDCHHVHYPDNNVIAKRRSNSTSALQDLVPKLLRRKWKTYSDKLLHMNARHREIQEFTLTHSLRYGLVELHLIQGKNLMAMDMNGSSDPFIEIKVNGVRKFKSKVKKNTLNPVWNEMVTLQLPKCDEYMDIIVWDKDPFGQDFLGSVTFTADELKQHGCKAEPEWYTLHGVKHGQIEMEVKPSVVEDGQTQTSHKQEDSTDQLDKLSEDKVTSPTPQDNTELGENTTTSRQTSQDSNEVFINKTIQEEQEEAQTESCGKTEQEHVLFNLDDCLYEEPPAGRSTPKEDMPEDFSTPSEIKNGELNTSTVSQIVYDSTTRSSLSQKPKITSQQEADTPNIHTNCPLLQRGTDLNAQMPISNVYRRGNGSVFTVAKQIMKQRETERHALGKNQDNIEMKVSPHLDAKFSDDETILREQRSMDDEGINLSGEASPRCIRSESSSNSHFPENTTGEPNHSEPKVVYRTRSTSPSRSGAGIEKKRLSQNHSLPPIPGSPLVSKAMSSDNFPIKHTAELPSTQPEKKSWYSTFKPSSIRKSWRIRKALSEANVHKPASPTRATKAAAPSNMYRGVQGKVLGARGLTVHQGDLYCKVRLERFSPYKSQKQSRGKEIAKSPVVRACAEPDFHLEFDLDEGQGIHENSVLIFDVKNVRKEHIGQRGVSLRQLLKDSQEVTKWLSLEGSIELQVQVSAGNASQSGNHTLPRKSPFKLLRS